MSRRHSSQKKVRAVYSQTVLPDNVKPQDQKQYMQGPTEETVLPAVIMKISTQAVMKLGGFQSRQELMDSRPSSRSKAVRQSVDSVPNKALPKVFEPYDPIPGKVPRHVAIERLRRKYESVNLNELLDHSTIDMDKRGEKCLEVVNFCMDDFSGIEEYFGQPDTLVAGKGLKYHKGKWRFKSFAGLEYKNYIVKGKWSRSGEQFELHKLYVWLCFEDPTAYLNTLVAAFKERDRCVASLQYNFILDNLPDWDVPDIPQRNLISIVKNCCASNRERESLNLLISEINGDYRRTLNKLMVNELSSKGLLEFPVSIEPRPTKVVPYLTKVGLVAANAEQITYLKPTEVEARKWPSFSNAVREFCFNSLLVNESMPQLLIKANCIIMSLAGMPIFDFSIEHAPFFLDEFTARQQNCVVTFGYYIRDSWIPDIVEAITTAFKEDGKGWYNLKEATKTVYEMGKLRKLIKMLRLKIQDALKDYLVARSKQFVDFVLSFRPSRVYIGSVAEVNNLFEVKDQPALFFTDLTKTDRGVFTYNLQREALTVSITFILNRLFSELSKVPDLEPLVLPQFFPSTKLQIYIKTPTLPKQKPVRPDPNKLPRTYIDEDHWVWELYEWMRSEIAVCAVPLDEYMTELKKFEYLTDTNKFIKKLREIEHDHRDVYYIRECLFERKKLRKSLQQFFPADQHVGIYRVTLTSMKEWMVESISDNVRSLIGLIYRRLREQTNKVLNRLIVIDDTLTKTPADVESLIQAMRFTSSSELQIEELCHLIRQCSDIYDMLEEERYRLSRDQLDARWNMLIRINSTKQTCAQKAKEYKNLRQIFESRLNLEQEQFLDALRGMRQSVSRFARHNDISRREEFYKATIAIGDSITLMQAQANTLKNRRELLHLSVEDYSEIFELQKQFQPYQELWRSIYQWRINYETWMKSPMDSFELVDPQMKVEELLQSSERLVNEFSGRNNSSLIKLSDEIRQELLDFRPKLPLLIALKREGLNERHLREISDTIRQTYNPNHEFRFEQAVEMGMLNYTDQIAQISQRAFKEHNIQRILDQVRGEVTSLTFALSSFPNIRGDHQTYIVMNLEQTSKSLDKHMLTVQSVQYNPSMKPFMKQINELAEIIRISSDTVDEWTTFQRHWVYLSPIFDSPELQKQIPQESKKFKNSDHMWKAVMAHAKSFVKVVDCCMEEGTYQRLREGNKNLEAVRRQLTAYLQLKREGFARFYFLSDFELLELLSKARKIETVQPYLKRVFENVEAMGVERETIFSVEGRYQEKLMLILPVRLHKVQTENWFKELDERIKLTIRGEIYRAFQSYKEDNRIKWMLAHPAQAVLAARQTLWTQAIEKNLEDLSSLEISEREQLNKLVSKVRQPLSEGNRATLNCLIVMEVHNLDILDSMNKTQHNKQFEWQKHIRYYSESEDIYVDCMLTHFPYGYEYLGSVSRLVATPLTDRCYITLMGALKLGIGGASYGPPGTGKTETTKDLAKILAKQCVVLNCSASMDYLMIGKFFRGLAGSGAWTCLDEFNRINPEVLSVLAEQLSYYFSAKARKQLLIEIQGHSVMLDSTFSVFVTMNPGIAGRAELPQNLKALFKSVAMIVPDLWMIAQIILYSYGFGNCRELAKKIVAAFKLASEQLSIQQHYDYGMRAIKSVLSLVGRLRMDSKQSDQAIVLTALRNSTIPKLVKHDISLFEDILKDIFGGVQLVQTESNEFVDLLARSSEEAGLTLTSQLKAKMLQLRSTIRIRHGIMLVGEAGTGKTELYRIVAKALEANLTVIYPKAVSIDELFGSFNDLTRQWSDGIINIAVRQCLRSTQLNWIVMDGPIDPLWVENFNTVLDDSKKLCLNSGESLILTDLLLLMFEVDSLRYASPATVSRCGMVYMEAATLPLSAVFEKYIKALPLVLKSYGIEPILRSVLPFLLEVIATQHQHPLIRIKEIALMENCMKMFECFTVGYRQSQFRTVTQKEVKQFIEHSKQLLVFCAIWAIGSLVQPLGISSLTKSVLRVIKLPSEYSIFDIFLDTDGWYDWKPWVSLTESAPVTTNRPYHKIQISSNYSIRTNYLLSRLIGQQLHCMNVGSAGVGKSQTVLQSLSRLSRNFISCLFNFTAWTSAAFVSTIVESKLEKKNKKRFVPPNGRKLVITIDDVDMPKLEEYGAQPPIELLRQLLNEHGWYRNQTFASIDSTVLVCNLTVSERVQLSHRFLRKFVAIGISDFSEKELVSIFSSIVSQSYASIDQSLKSLIDSVVRSSVKVYKEMKAVMLPTPKTLHYSFTSRDLYRLFEGMCLAKADDLDSQEKIVKLYVHEMRRTFQDRLSQTSDIAAFNKFLVASLSTEQIPFSQGTLSALFYTFASGRTSVDYKESLYFETLVREIENYQDQYNYGYKSTLRLVYFRQACQHIVRISRVLSMHRGNIILCGLGGSGRESLAKMAVFICSHLHASITSGVNYTLKEWRTDLKDYLLACGLEQRSTTLILTQSQLTMEPQLEDLNSLLTSLDLPVIYSEKDMGDICQACRIDCIREGLETTRINLYSRFVERLKSLFHMVLLLSPQHKDYALRVRSFPSLTAACVFDWFHGWPEDALLRVARAELTDTATEYAIEDIDGLAETVKQQYLVVNELNRQYESQFGEKYFITPNSYLAFIEQIKNTIKHQEKHYQEIYGRYFKGLSQIERTELSVDEMRLQLKSMQPRLIITQDETNRILVVLTRDNEEAMKMQASLQKQQIELNISMAEAREMQNKLEKAQLETEEKLKLAWEKAQLIKPSHISEIKALPNPSEVIRLVLAGVVILLHNGQMIMDKQIGEKAEENYFETAKKYILSRDANSLSRLLINYDKESTKQMVITKLEEKVLNHPRWNQKEAMNANKAIYYFYLWIDAIVTYHRILKETQPIREGLVRVKQEIVDKEKRIGEISEALGKFMQKIKIIQKNYNDKKTLLESLEVAISSCSDKLDRAFKLIEGLKQEKTRWAMEVERLSKQMESLVGDSLVLAGMVSFGGFYNSEWRAKLVDRWRSHMKIPYQKKKGWELYLSRDGFANWKLAGLPPNDNGLENATIMQLTLKKCLFIDPQNQAISFLKSLARNEKIQLDIIKASDPTVMRLLEKAVQFGTWVLITSVGKQLDQSLEPYLNPCFIQENSQQSLVVWEKAYFYHAKFQMYMCSDQRSEFSPESCNSTTVVNFSITPDQLYQQMLSLIVSLEAPSLEEKKAEVLKRLAIDERHLERLSDEILDSMAKQDVDELLSSDAMLTRLQSSRRVYIDIMKRYTESLKVGNEIEKARNSYTSDAQEASDMFFVVSMLKKVNTMYQVSLEWYTKIYARNGKNNFREYLWSRVSLFLEERHRLLASMLFAELFVVKDKDEWKCLYELNVEEAKENPTDYIPSSLWQQVYSRMARLERLPSFKGLYSALQDEPTLFKKFYTTQKAILPYPYDNLSPFQSILLVNCLRPQLVVKRVRKWIGDTLGQPFIRPVLPSLSSIIAEIDFKTPALLITGVGSNIYSDFIAFAQASNMMKRIETISLGQGQSQRAEVMIQTAVQKGNWVLMENCHLSLSWMPKLVSLMEIMENHYSKDFKLFLSSMPCNELPSYMVRNCVKLNVSEPLDLLTGMTRVYSSLTKKDFKLQDIQFDIGMLDDRLQHYRKTLYALAMLHCSMQERKKFVPVGWNIPYAFTLDDLLVSQRQLKIMCQSERQSNQVLRFLVGEINYGGRVTDQSDFRLLQTLTESFLNEQCTNLGFKFEGTNITNPPCNNIEDYLAHIQSNIPPTADTQLLGLHPNVALVADRSHIAEALDSIKTIYQGKRKHSEEETQLKATITYILASLPKILPHDHVAPEYRDSFHVLLLQEIDRYSTLLDTILEGLKVYQEAEQGKCLMTEELESMRYNLAEGRVPKAWNDRCYYSNKQLGEWLADLTNRLRFINQWIRQGAPTVFWMGGLFLPQNLLAVLIQNHARKYKLQVDSIQLATRIVREEDEKKGKLEFKPLEGYYVEGIYLQACSFERQKGILIDAQHGQLTAKLPILHIVPYEEGSLPTNTETIEETPTGHSSLFYKCPLYRVSDIHLAAESAKTSNFIMQLDIPTERPARYWIRAGASAYLSS